MNRYQLTVLHRHASTQGESVLAECTSSLSTASPFKDCQYFTTRSHTSNDFQKILDELVYIEKKYWTKSQSWGDQFQRLTVQKQNAYTFVLLSLPEGTADESSSRSPVVHQGQERSCTVVAYCVMYANALHGQLSKVWVRPEERNKGCATFLLSYAFEYFRAVVIKKGEYSVVLFVETGNCAAINVYGDKLGFSVEEPMLLDYYYPGSHAFRMRLEISS